MLDVWLSTLHVLQLLDPNVCLSNKAHHIYKEHGHVGKFLQPFA